MSKDELPADLKALLESVWMTLPQKDPVRFINGREVKHRYQKMLTELEQSEISFLFDESNVRKKPIKIRLYDPFEHLTVIGVVERVDKGAGRFMVEGEWFEIGKIEGAAACQEREGDEYYG